MGVLHISKKFFAISLMAVMMAGALGTASVAEMPGETPATLTPADVKEGMLPVSLIKGRVSSQPSKYIFGPGDRVGLKIQDLDKFNQEFVVRPDGFATIHPFGEFYIAGADVKSLESWLEEKFKFYLLEPKISVDVVEMRNALVYISGAVKRPGTYQFLRNVASNKAVGAKAEHVEMTLSNVIGRAGGVNEHADIEHITVLHASTGQKEYLNLREMLSGAPVEDVWLLPGDSLVIPEMDQAMDPQTFQLVSRSNYYSEKFPVMVLGAVGAQGEIQIDPNNNTLNAAIAQAGGYMDRVSDQDQVIVQRPTNNGAYSRWVVDAKKSQLELMPGDVVYVTHSKMNGVEHGLKVLGSITAPFMSSMLGINSFSNLSK